MWNYRLCKNTYRTSATNPEEITCVSYEIHETYYNNNGDIWAVNEEPVTVGAYIDLPSEETEAEKLIELGLTLDQMRVALHKGIIDLDTFEFANHDNEDDDGEFIELDAEEDSEDN